MPLLVQVKSEDQRPVLVVIGVAACLMLLPLVDLALVCCTRVEAAETEEHREDLLRLSSCLPGCHLPPQFG
jgi:hypothetical protein